MFDAGILSRSVRSHARSLGARVAQLAAVIVLGPPLLLLLVLSGIGTAPATPTSSSPEFPTGVVGPVPTTLAGSDAREVAVVPPDLRGDFLAAARQYALPPALLAAIGEVESGFNPNAVGPPVPDGPAEGMMQFLPSSWALFNPIPGATPYDPGPAVLATARHLLSSGALPGGGFDATAALFGYNHSHSYGQTVLALAARYGYRYTPDRPPNDPVRYHYPLAHPAASLAVNAAAGVTLRPAATAGGRSVLACVRAAVVSVTAHGLVLRGEDGFLFTYSGLRSVSATVRGGVVVDPGTALATSGDALGFGIRHDSASPPLDPRPYLAHWPTTAVIPASSLTSKTGATA